ncbi:MAG: hypothetical protein ACN4E2_04570 [Nitrospinota bacterium]
MKNQQRDSRASGKNFPNFGKAAKNRYKVKTNSSKKNGEVWSPLHDLKLRAPISSHKGMTIEERKVAQLKKWRKELGLDQ